MPKCRLAEFTGNSFAAGWLPPFLKTSGFAAGRTAAVIHTRPLWSNIGLWTLVLLVQIASSPQVGDAAGICGEVGGVAGSRTLSCTRLVVWRMGSSTGR